MSAFFNLVLGATLLPTVLAAKVVTLGDSYSSGIGYYRDIFQYDDLFLTTEILDGATYELTGGDFCARAVDVLAGARLAKAQGIEEVMIACGGARLANLRQQIDYMNQLHSDERTINWAGSTIIMTIGLNDLRSVGGSGWLSTLQSCYLDVMGDCSSRSENQVNNTDTVKTEMESVFQLLVSEASDATIRIFGYGKLFQRNGEDCKESLLIGTGIADLLDDDYFGAINKVSADVIAAIKKNNPTVDIEFVDVDNYRTIGSCTSKKPHLNGIVGCFPTPYSPASYHPSASGFGR